MATEGALPRSQEPGRTGSTICAITGLECGSVLGICISDFESSGSTTEWLSSIVGTIFGPELVFRAVLVGYKIVSNMLASRLWKAKKIQSMVSQFLKVHIPSS
jgi:hypothetical protein